MPTPPLSRELAQQAINIFAKHNSIKRAADELGMHPNTFENRLHRAKMMHLEAEQIAPPPMAEGKGLRVLVIPDMHAPFQHLDALNFLTAAKEKYTPQRIVCLGDETDQHVLGRYEADPDGYSAGHEHNMALEFMYQVYELFPVMALCTSNHGERIFKRAYRSGIPKAFMKEYAEFMDAPKGWHWAHKHEIDNVIYEHGEGVSGQLGAMKKAMSNGYRNTVIGHLHADAGVLWQSCGDKQIFALNAGCLIDEKAYAFAYGKNSARKPMIGIGLVDKGVPSFIPMKQKDGRWTGEL